MFDILVLGELNADMILQGDVEPAWAQAEKLIDDFTITLGGSSAIFASGAARLGLQVCFTGVIGDDLLGHFCREALVKRGVDVSGVLIDPTQRTGVTMILQRPDDRAMLTFSGAIAALSAEHIDQALLQQSRHLHVGSYWLQTALWPGLPGIFADARRRGATTSLDTNWDPSGQWAGLDELLAQTDILLPNEAEACAIAAAISPAGGSIAVEEALEILAARVPAVAIKCGANGAIGARGTERASAPPVRVKVVDAVGAGDSFDAGFICGALAGWSLERCLALGVACGSLSTRAAGGTDAQPTLDEALQALGSLV